MLEGLKGIDGYKDSAGYVTADHLHDYVFDMMTEKERIPQKPIKKARVSGDIMVAYYPPLPTQRPEPFHSPSTPSPDISSIISEGIECEKDGDHDGAIALFNRAIKINPSNPVPHNHKGDILFAKGDHNGAIAEFDKSIAASPSNAIAYNHKGDVLFDLKRYKESIDCYDSALVINPNYFDVLKDKGLAHYKLKDYRKAVESYNKALVQKPNHEQVLEYKKEALRDLEEIENLEKGISLYDSGTYEEAIEYFDRSLNANPRNPDTLYNKGSALSHISKYREAIECFEESLRIKPANNEAVKANEDAHKKQSQKESSLAIEEGLGHINNSDYRSAIDSFDKSIRLNPENYIPYSYKADVLFKLNEHEEAINYYDRALKIKPDYYYGWYSKGEIFSSKCKNIHSDDSSEFVECFRFS